VPFEEIVKRSTPLVSAKPLKAFTAENSIGSCTDCEFGKTFIEKKSRFGAADKFRKGDWKNAIIVRAGTGENDTQRRNVNEFLKYVPIVVIPKGTEFFHVTASDDWVTKSMVGAAVLDGYSFFTLRAKGFASVHGNQFNARIQLRAFADVDCFFVKQYAFNEWKLKTQYNRLEIDGPTQPLVGGDLASMIQRAWPYSYRPTVWASCRECEIAIHNSYIPKILETTAIATSTDHFATTKKIVPIENLPTGDSSPGTQYSIPGWMGPNNSANQSAVEKVMALKARTAYWNDLSAPNSPLLKYFGY
jgi:hypothetical protein